MNRLPLELRLRIFTHARKNAFARKIQHFTERSRLAVSHGDFDQRFHDLFVWTMEGPSFTIEHSAWYDASEIDGTLVCWKWFHPDGSRRAFHRYR